MPKTKKNREKILDVTARLFYENGYKATGVESIAKASGITKATLYHHFSDKNALIVEALSYLSELHKKSYIEAWDKKGLTDLQKLTVLFDEMDEIFKQADFYGCPFINASGEFTDRDNPARKVCESHYQFLIGHLENFARNAKLKQPKAVAEKIATVIAGTYAGWHVGGISKAAKNGKETAMLIIKQHQKDLA
jgi:AcrR family transcriptional regulator